MHLFRLFFLLSTIKNNNLPVCKDCIHFLPYKYHSKNPIIYLDKCSKFGEKNIITGEINYDYVDECRKDENKCGLNATYFSGIKKTNTK